MRVGINASRARSGGAKAHIIGILSNAVPTDVGIDEIHVWAHKALYDELPEKPWLHKHVVSDRSLPLVKELWWEWFRLPALLKAANCQILLNLDAGSICPFTPSVTMSRDMLSYEPGELQRFGFSLSTLRLIALRYIQNRSLRRAKIAIFLTKYAGAVIQKSCGKLHNVVYIPHGVGDEFRSGAVRNTGRKSADPVQCLYVSNALPYKHQWTVIEAIGSLKKKGYDVKLLLVGGGVGQAQRLVEQQIAATDPEGGFIEQKEFVPQSNLPDYLSKADVFIFASSCENMPNTLLEAMAMGLPIACSDRGPMPEVLEDGGVYFDPEDASQIASAVENLIEDPKKAMSLASRALELSSKYSWERCARETFEVLATASTQLEREA